MIAICNFRWFARWFVRINLYILIFPLAVSTDCVEMCFRATGISVQGSRFLARLGVSVSCCFFCYRTILILGWNTQIINSQDCEFSYMSLPCSISILSHNVAVLAAQASLVALDFARVMAQLGHAFVVHPWICTYLALLSIAIVQA